MQTSAALNTEDVPFAMRKVHLHRPAFGPTDRTTLVVIDGFDIDVGGTVHSFRAAEPVIFDDASAQPGADYLVIVTAAGALEAVPHTDMADGLGTPIGGFHYAPGGNAAARQGGDDVPAINPNSCWDLGFRPACADPRGLALVTLPNGHRFWDAIYFLGINHHVAGPSRFGAIIADGSDRPLKPDGSERYRKLDYATACEIAAHHGMRLATVEERFASGFGVTERSSADERAERAGLDMARTSHAGLMQASGQRWSWCTDGDPDDPRASIVGGSWLGDSHAGSRCAGVAYDWPGYSSDDLGLRACSDHLVTV